MLLDAGADPDPRPELLEHASKYAMTDLVPLVVRKIGQTDQHAEQSAKALRIAAGHEQLAVVKFLVEHGVSTLVDANYKNDDPLKAALEGGHSRTAIFLAAARRDDLGLELSPAAATEDQLLSAVFSGESHRVRQLLSDGPQVRLDRISRAETETTSRLVAHFSPPHPGAPPGAADGFCQRRQLSPQQTCV